MGFYPDHGIELRDKNNKNVVVSSKQIDRILEKSQYYLNNKSKWYDENSWNYEEPILIKDLDFSIESIKRDLDLDIDVSKEYEFYHVYKMYDSLR